MLYTDFVLSKPLQMSECKRKVEADLAVVTISLISPHAMEAQQDVSSTFVDKIGILGKKKKSSIKVASRHNLFLSFPRWNCGLVHGSEHHECD